MKYLLSGEEKLYNNVYKTLNNQNTTTEEKQLELENITHQSKEYKINNDFSIPNKIKPLIKKIDDYISNANLNDVKSFLPYQIIENLSKNLTINNKQNLTEAKKKRC